MAEITTRERVMNVYRGRVPDRIPIAIYTHYLPRGSEERTLRDMGVALLDVCPVTALAPPWKMDPGYVAEVRGADFDIRFDWENGERIETRTYATPLGVVKQRLRKDPTYESDWVQEFYIKRREDYRIVQFLVENTVLRRNEAALRSRREAMGEDGVILGRVDRCPFQMLLVQLAGPERFLVDLQTDPDPVLSLLEALNRKMDEVFEIVSESEIQVVWEPAQISGDMTPPKYFERFCLPYYAKHAAQLHERGKLYLVHMDGRLRSLQKAIGRTPIDVVESFSLPEVGGDLPLVEACAAWPDKAVVANFPSSLAVLDEAATMRFLDGLREEVERKRPFMLQISEDLPAGTWRHLLPLMCARLQR